MFTNEHHNTISRADRMTSADVSAAIVLIEGVGRGGKTPAQKSVALDAAADAVGKLKWTADGVLEGLSVASRFCERPELALHYYHGLSCDHNAWLYNDEDPNNAGVANRN